MNEYQNNHLERNSELIQLTKISDRIIKDNTTEIIYIVGNAGMGKTQLIKEFHKSIEMREHNWIFMPCDVILAKSLNPVEYFFNIFFDQSPEINMQENKANFEKKIDHLLEVSNNQELKSELIRTKYLIGSIINLFWKNSLYDELDAKIRYDNIIYAIKNLFLILSDLKQTFIVVEDSNWMDHDTKKLFEVLFRNTRNIPFTTILLCRSDEDGSHFKLGIDDIRENKISLEPFNKETTRYLVDEFLNRDNKKRIKIPEDTLDLIWKRSKGNPFVLKYVLQYIENKDILDRSLHIKVGSNVPSNTDFFILAKFEMLSPRLKEITEMASILGKNFTTSILQKMLNNKKIDKYIHEGMKENLWYSLSKLNHTFENEYIRKTIYENALKRTRIHKLAARSIEKVHKNNLENYYPDLAYNYEKAEVVNKAIFYLEKAGDHAKEIYHNQSALEYYDKLLNILSEDDENKDFVLKIALNKIEIHLVLGNTNTVFNELKRFNFKESPNSGISNKFHFLVVKNYVAIQDYQKSLSYINDNSNKITNRFYKNNLDIYNLDSLRLLNKHKQFEEKAHQLLQNFQNTHEEYFTSKILKILGAYYFQRSNYDKALEYYKTNYKIVLNLKDNLLIQHTVHNIGIAYFHQGNRKKANIMYLKSLEIAEKIGNKQECSRIYSDLASVLTKEGKTDEAIYNYQKSLGLAKEVGNRMQEGLVLYNIAEIHFSLGNYEKSLKYLEGSRKICENISDIVGLTYANDLYGDILFALKRMNEAEDVYNENLKLQEKLEDIGGIAHTYGNLGRIASNRIDYKTAEEYYRKQQNILSDIGDKEGEGKAFFNWATMEKSRKRNKRALRMLQKALILFEESSFQKGIYLTSKLIEQLKK